MKEVVIIGKGNGWERAPFNVESWGITQLILKRKVDRVIDLNDYLIWGEKEAEEAREARRMADQEGIPYIDMASYPLMAIIKELGSDYFGSTVDYAIALAIFEKYQKIDLYGVNMDVDSEYSYQKPSCDFWCGYAKGKGIEVGVHGIESHIMRTRDSCLYGYGFPQLSTVGR